MKHLKYFSEIQSEIKGAPNEVKESYNKILSYFSAHSMVDQEKISKNSLFLVKYYVENGADRINRPDMLLFKDEDSAIEEAKKQVMETGVWQIFVIQTDDLTPNNLRVPRYTVHSDSYSKTPPFAFNYIEVDRGEV